MIWVEEGKHYSSKHFKINKCSDIIPKPTCAPVSGSSTWRDCLDEAEASLKLVDPGLLCFRYVSKSSFRASPMPPGVRLSVAGEDGGGGMSTDLGVSKPL